MKTPLKAAIIGVSAVALAFLGALLLAPFLLKGRVIELVESQISARVDATVTFEDVDLTLLSTFPTLNVEVVGLEVAGVGEFEGITLASVGSIRTGVDLPRLVRDEELLIESAVVRRPEVHLIVNENGKANYDIVREEANVSDEPAGLRFRLQQIEVEGGRLDYEAPGTEVRLEGLVHEGSATIEGARYTASSRTTVESLTVRIGDVEYVGAARATVDLTSVLHADEQQLDLERLEVALNELTGEAVGTIRWGDDRVHLDLALESGKGQSLRALVPA